MADHYVKLIPLLRGSGDRSHQGLWSYFCIICNCYIICLLRSFQLDATSLFYSLFPRVGAESVVTSFVPLLVAAEAIGKISKKEKDTWEHDIMFALFNTVSSLEWLLYSILLYFILFRRLIVGYSIEQERMRSKLRLFNSWNKHYVSRWCSKQCLRKDEMEILVWICCYYIK